MQLYYDPITTTSRPILLFLADHDVPGLTLVETSLLEGGHLSEAYAAINPNRTLPALVDGDLSIAESSAILKHLADVGGSPAYPSERRARSRINAAMDWVNTGLTRDLGYGFIYPRLFPNHAWSSPVTQADVVERGRINGERWLTVMDRHMLGDQGPYLCGGSISLADDLACGIFSLVDAVSFDLAAWPNVSAWLTRMKARPSWPQVHAAFYGFLAALRSARPAAA